MARAVRKIPSAWLLRFSCLNYEGPTVLGLFPPWSAHQMGRDSAWNCSTGVLCLHACKCFDQVSGQRGHSQSSLRQGLLDVLLVYSRPSASGQASRGPCFCPSPTHLRCQPEPLTHCGCRGEAPGESATPHFHQSSQRVQQIELPCA